VQGDLFVGPNNGAGKINSGGTVANPQNLSIGAGTETANLQLGRAGQLVDFNTLLRMNGNGMIMNNAASLTAANGFGIVLNPVGWGNGPSYDFYFNGMVLRYCDATGWF